MELSYLFTFLNYLLLFALGRYAFRAYGLPSLQGLTLARRERKEQQEHAVQLLRLREEALREAQREQERWEGRMQEQFAVWRTKSAEAVHRRFTEKHAAYTIYSQQIQRRALARNQQAALQIVGPQVMQRVTQRLEQVYTAVEQERYLDTMLRKSALHREG